jgi:F0F1-type ATP synthase assembly protein I
MSQTSGREVVCCAAQMTQPAASSPHSLATASGLLLGALGAAMLVGALIGWALGSWGVGLLVGAIAGIPLGVLIVYKVYASAGAR